ncbi:hypothetical protein Taro_011156 [Colocasia esculenta]|uniref:Uncharacterized protein n=1 Tax=Colocasia esculenta TaxID=4460 RepID=A0A843U552_COLES|nr:hypothetical protein [Colocasia esculenta]
MVRGVRLSSSSGRSNRGRGLLTASSSSEFTPPHPRVPGPVPEDVFSLREGGGSFHENTLRESNHRFARCSDVVRFRLVWTTTARSNFKHLLYNARKNAQKAC